MNPNLLNLFLSRVDLRLLTPYLAVLVGFSASLPTNAAIDLRGSVWERAAKRHNLDPLLVYALALYESRRSVGAGYVAPHQWAMNSSISGSLHPKSATEAIARLREELKKTTLVDIGAMQVSWRWNGNRVSDPIQLLNLETNVDVGAAVLREAIMSAPGDLELGIGRYHTWTRSREKDARQYGKHVLRIWQRLIRA